MNELFGSVLDNGGAVSGGVVGAVVAVAGKGDDVAVGTVVGTVVEVAVSLGGGKDVSDGAGDAVAASSVGDGWIVGIGDGG